MPITIDIDFSEDLPTNERESYAKRIIEDFPFHYVDHSEAFKALMGKESWTDADIDAVTDLWSRAGMDTQLNTQMEALQCEWLRSEGLEVTPDDVARAQKIVNRAFREYFEERD